MFNLFNFEFSFKGFNLHLPFLRKKTMDKTNASILFIDDEDFPVVAEYPT